MENQFKNILLVQTGFIGDVILSTPVISAIKEMYPNSSLSLLTTPIASTLFKNDTRLNEVISYDKRGKQSGISGLLGMARELKSRNFDVVFSLHKSYRTSMLLFLSEIPIRFGFKEAKLSRLYSKTIRREKESHDVLRNLSILKNVGFDTKSLDLRMKIDIGEKLRSETRKKFNFIEGKKLVVVAPGSVWLTKRWTEEGYAGLISKLLDFGFFVILIGGEGDKSVGEVIEKKVVEEKSLCGDFRNYIGELNLLESAALIEMASVLVANDSAPLHLASALHSPVVAIFCATVPDFGFGPWMTRHEILEVKELSCRPCGRHGGNSCPTGTNFCRTQIDDNDVFNAVVRLSNEQ